MKKFSEFLEDIGDKAENPDTLSDMRTELETMNSRIKQANSILSHARDAELADAKEVLLTLKNSTEEFLDQIKDILSGRSYHS